MTVTPAGPLDNVDALDVVAINRALDHISENLVQLPLAETAAERRAIAGRIRFGLIQLLAAVGSIPS